MPAQLAIGYFLYSIAGLQIRSKGDATLHSFEFTWAPVAQTTGSLNWTPLTKHEVTYKHIRCHQLQEAESTSLPLKFLLANLDSCASTIALLIINTKNSYDIEASLLPESETSPFPILIVTSETGKALSDLLDAGEVEAKIELPASLSVGNEPVKAEEDDDSFVEIGMFLHYLLVTTTVRSFKLYLLYMNADIPEDEQDCSTLHGMYYWSYCVHPIIV